jgi:serine protease Do
MLIYDRYLEVESGKKRFQHLFERADHYDNILVERFGAKWKYEDSTEE